MRNCACSRAVFDISRRCDIIYNMKKVIFILLGCVLVLAACGVKSDLSRPSGPLRNYPVY